MSKKGYKRTITLGFDYNEVKNGVPKANQQLKLLNTEFKRLTAEAKLYNDSSSLIQATFKKNAETVKILEGQVEAYKKELENLQNAEKKNERAIRDKTIALEQTKAKLSEAILAEKEYKDEIEELAKVDYDKKLEEIGAAYEKQAAAAETNSRSMDKVRAVQEKAQKTIAVSKEQVDKLTEELADLEKESIRDEKAIADLKTQIDKANTTIIRSEQELEKANRKIKEQETFLGKASTQWKDFKNKMQEAGVDVDDVTQKIERIGIVLAGIGVAGGKLYLDFGKEFQKVKTIADETQVSFKDLESGVLDISKAYNVEAGGAANALYDLLSASVETSDGLLALEKTAKLSKVGITDMKTAGDLLTTVMNTYGVSIQDADKYMDQFVITQKLAKTTIGEMGDNFGKVAGLAGTAKIPFEEIGAALAVTTNKGLSTEEALTGIRAVLTSVISPTEEAKQKAKELGINLSLTNLQAKGFAGFMQEVTTKTRGNNEVITTLFGNVRAMNTALMLTSQEGMSEFNAKLTEIQNAAGASDDAFAAIQDTAEKWGGAMTAMKGHLIEVGAALSPIIDALSFVLVLISKMPPKVTATIAIIGGVIATAILLVKAIDKVSSTVSATSKALKAAKAAADAGTWGFKEYAIAIAGVVLILTALAAIIAVIMGRSGELNSAMKNVGNIASQAKGAVGNARVQSRAIGTSYSNAGRTRLHEYGDEIIDLPKGSRVYTAEQSRQMINNTKDDGETADLLKTLIGKVEALTSTVKYLPDRQILLARE